MVAQAPNYEIEKVEVPEWGGFICVRGMTGKELNRFQETIIKQRGNKQVLDMTSAREQVAIMCCCDEAGKSVFNDSDLAMLSEKGAGPLQRIFDVAQRLSGLTDEEVEKTSKN